MLSPKPRALFFNDKIMKDNRVRPGNIVLLGDYPPPQGGNSVHIQRLQKALQSEEIYCDAIDISPGGDEKSEDYGNVFRVAGFLPYTLVRTLCILWRLNPKILHIHISAFQNFSKAALILNLPIRKRTRLALTIHSGSAREGFENLSVIQKMMVKWALKRYDNFIAVNIDQVELIRDLGFGHKEVAVIPAFLPPGPNIDQEDLSESLAPLKQDGRKLICASGNGIRLYGFENIVAAMLSSELAATCALVICIYDKTDDDYMDEVRALLSQLPNWLLLRDLDADQFGYILSNSDVYVRATDRDGDAVAIREANEFGVPIVASTVVKRPDYCYLFERENSEELAHMISKAIDSYECADLGSKSGTENYEKIKSFLQIEY